MEKTREKDKDELFDSLIDAHHHIRELEMNEGKLRLELRRARKDETIYRMIFENAHDGIAIFEDLPGGAKRLVECNDKYVEMSGYSRDQLLAVGDPESLAVNHGTPDDFAENRRKNMAYEPYSGTFSWKRPDGRENYVKYNTAFIYAGGKKLKIGIDHDITDLVKAEKELELHRQRLESLVAERTVELLQVTRELESAQSAIHGFKKQVRKLRERNEKR